MDDRKKLLHTPYEISNILAKDAQKVVVNLQQ
jgi:hypothetical protein